MNLPVKDILFLQNKVAYTRDEDAYKQLFFHFYGSLHRFAIGLIHNNEVAEEIVSDTMMKIWDAGSKLAQIEKLNLYLFTAVKNSCISFLSKKKFDSIEPENAQDDNLINYQNPESQFIATEIEQLINKSIKDLSPQCRMVYRLIKDEGFSYKEVTIILQISQNTVETHMRIALKKIRAVLNHYLSKK